MTKNQDLQNEVLRIGSPAPGAFEVEISNLLHGPNLSSCSSLGGTQAIS